MSQAFDEAFAAYQKRLERERRRPPQMHWFVRIVLFSAFAAMGAIGGLGLVLSLALLAG